MLVKVINECYAESFEDNVNEFIRGKKIIKIKFCAVRNKSDSIGATVDYIAFIVYEE